MTRVDLRHSTRSYGSRCIFRVKSAGRPGRGHDPIPHTCGLRAARGYAGLPRRAFPQGFASSRAPAGGPILRSCEFPLPNGFRAPRVNPTTRPHVRSRTARVPRHSRVDPTNADVHARTSGISRGPRVDRAFPLGRRSGATPPRIAGEPQPATRPTPVPLLGAVRDDAGAPDQV